MLGKLFGRRKKKNKKSKSERKAARSSKKAARKKKKADKKSAKKSKKTKKTKSERKMAKSAKKSAKSEKKAAKKAAKSERKAERKANRQNKERSGNVKEWLKNNLTIENAAATADLVNTLKNKKSRQYSDDYNDDYDEDTRRYAGGGNQNENGSDIEKKEKVKKALKWGAAGIGVLALGLGIRAVIRSGNKTRKSQSKLGKLSKIKLK